MGHLENEREITGDLRGRNKKSGRKRSPVAGLADGRRTASVRKTTPILRTPAVQSPYGCAPFSAHLPPNLRTLGRRFPHTRPSLARRTELQGAEFSKRLSIKYWLSTTSTTLKMQPVFGSRAESGSEFSNLRRPFVRFFHSREQLLQAEQGAVCAQKERESRLELEHPWTERGAICPQKEGG